MKFVMTLVFISVAACVTGYAADPPVGEPKIGSLSVGKVLYLGNSITLHGPAPKIGWTGNWGMAASAAKNDYVHLLTADFARASGRQPQIMVRNMARFEREYGTFKIEEEFKDELDFEADLVIVAIGENVTTPATDEAKAAFANAFAQLIATIQQHGDPEIFARSSFWPNSTKDDIMRQVTAEAGATFIDISELGDDKSNQASAEQPFEHAGVAAHPGDKGMQAIATAIYAAIQEQAGVTGK
tara:strand:+ start:534 stop:1259 length:726 start_codon:yes stop_codon:yes gene_type:complete